MKQTIKRSDAKYIELDAMESQVQQYYALRSYLHSRKMERVFGGKYGDNEHKIEFEIEYKISQGVKESIIEFITEHYKNGDIAHEVKEHIKSDIADLMDLFSIMAYFHKDESLQELLFDHFSDKANIFITNYDFYNDPNKQIWLRLDLSLSKAELLTQIGELKDAHEADNDNIFTFNGKTRIKENDEEWIGKGLNPLTFSKAIKRQFGDLLFVYDCINAGYKRQYIINESFNHRSKINDNNTALTHDTIKKYLKKADEVMETIIL
ncbi:MAG: hypothetical protein Q8S01_00945 [Ignavibacteria bacterium]|nr:hypothetical protein [Ignavibacteria bacterium]